MSTPDDSSSYPCALSLSIPFPTPRLAQIALRTLQVDPELSPLVRRHIALGSDPVAAAAADHARDQHAHKAGGDADGDGDAGVAQDQDTAMPVPVDPASLLRVHYRASTNRMLRVAVNSFLDSLNLSVEVMQFLDQDVLPAPRDAPSSGKP